MRPHKFKCSIIQLSPQAFRLFMSQMGLLSLENRHRMIPLRISEKLVNDLEKLDQLHEYVNKFTQIP